MHYTIRYFSATGNTARAVSIIRSMLEEAGHGVDTGVIGLEPPEPDILDRGGTLILAFPTLAWAPPAFVRRYMRRLPRGEGREAIILTADGGGSFTALPVAERLLRRRGYDVRLTAALSYSENWAQAMPIPASEQQERERIAGDAAATQAGRDILEGVRGRVGNPSPPLRLLLRTAGILFALVGRRFLGVLYFADERCSSCRFCARTCPAGTIRMSRRRPSRPRWGWNCEDCNRCINLCPEGAINVSLGRLIILLSAIVVLSVVGIGAFGRYIAPELELLLPSPVVVAVNVIAVALIITGAHFAVVLPPATGFLTALSRLPGLKRFFAWSHTSGGRRYRAPGFDPEAT